MRRWGSGVSIVGGVAGGGILSFLMYFLWDQVYRVTSGERMDGRKEEEREREERRGRRSRSWIGMSSHRSTFSHRSQSCFYKHCKHEAML
jgi:hypothetical protein